MTTDENILEEMLDRVTNPTRTAEAEDELAVQIFCMVVRSNAALVTKAHQLIVKKMHSQNVAEATRAIKLLEECMSKGGTEFQKKTAKFTFLNDLIALVLDKHQGPPVPEATKKRIMECLLLWTKEQSDKTKIRDAYDNLKKQVSIMTGNNDSNNGAEGASVASKMSDKRESILGKDDELVARLLKLGGEENFKRANLLIQSRYNQEARRTELREIKNTIELLNEMLDSWSSHADYKEEKEILQQLYESCKKHQPILHKMPQVIENADNQLIADILETNDLLLAVIQRYKEVVKDRPAPKTTTSVESSVSNIKLLQDVLGDSVALKEESNAAQPSSNTLDELSDIFGGLPSAEPAVSEPSTYPSDLLENFDLIRPIKVFDNNTEMKSTDEQDRDKGPAKTSAFRELHEIDKISEELLKQSLHSESRQKSFKKEPEKITLNELAKDQMKTVSTAKVNVKTTPTKSEAIKTAPLESPKPEGTNADDVQQSVNEEKAEFKDAKELPFKHLSEISVDLDDITPLASGERTLLNDDDISVTLNLTTDHPSQHVSVIVMTVSNKNRMPIKDFQFEASVKKPCKVRLLPPTDNAIAGFNPFRPPAPINQVMLLLNPTHQAVDITCIVSYKLAEDPDPIKESIVAKDIPYID